MKKVQLIELVKTELTGGSSALKYEDKYHDEVIALHIGMVFNGLVSSLTNPNLIDQFCVLYNSVAVLEENGVKYSTIPTTILTTDTFSGIRAINPTGDTSSQFFKRRNYSSPVYKHLEVDAYTLLAYYISGQRVVYEKINNLITAVDMSLLVPFEGIADNDEITMPDGKDSLAFQAILEQMREQKATPQTYKSDNNSNT